MNLCEIYHSYMMAEDMYKVSAKATALRTMRLRATPIWKIREHKLTYTVLLPSSVLISKELAPVDVISPITKLLY